MHEYNCAKYGGFVGQPYKVYGYAGLWCHCPFPTPPLLLSAPVHIEIDIQPGQVCVAL